MNATETRDYTGVTTEQIIVEMLTENTGSYITDSGSAYGRHWQRNQGRNFWDEPTVRSDFNVYRSAESTEPGRVEMCATVSLAHWMEHNLCFDAEMQAQLDQFAEEHPDMTWLVLQEEFAEWLAEREGHDTEPAVHNTYNYQDSCDLSQTLQYVHICRDGAYAPTHLIISVHGGCDVRGGYTAPKCFEIRKDEYEWLETMRVDGISAGGNLWHLQGYNDVEASEHNTCGTNLFDIPAYRLDWVETPETEELERVIAKAKVDKDLLDDTTLTGPRLDAARATPSQARSSFLTKSAASRFSTWPRRTSGSS
jgi:hypothetical protein